MSTTTRCGWNWSPAPASPTATSRCRAWIFTVAPALEHCNFGGAGPDTPIGWLGERGTAALRVRNARGEDVLAQYFTARDGRLYPSQKLRLFMVTTNPQIALSDCLLYASPEREHTRL
jgi:hypothetical protein